VTGWGILFIWSMVLRCAGKWWSIFHWSRFLCLQYRTFICQNCLSLVLETDETRSFMHAELYFSIYIKDKNIH